MQSLDVIIVNWNTGSQLRACLAALAQSRQEGYRLERVVVVDNASTDQSLEELDCASLPLAIIKNDVNRGFAAACNQGAAASSADYLLFLNPDTRVFQNTLSSSAQWMNEPANQHTGILGVQLLDDNGQIVRTCASFLATRYFVHRMFGLNCLLPKIFPGLLHTGWDHSESRRVDHVMGAYCFVRGSLFRELNGFDQRFFLYFEDVDLSLRMFQAGFSSYYLASAQCYHTGYGNSNRGGARRLFYCLQSRILYALKHFRMLDAAALLLATVVIEPLPRFGHALVKRSWRQLQTVAQAYRLLWRAMPGIIRQSLAARVGASPVQVAEAECLPTIEAYRE